MRGQRNAQRAAAAGDEQDVDAAGEDRANVGQRVLVVDGAIAGGEQQARRSIGDQEREPVARTEEHDLWRGEVPQPEGERGDGSRGGDEEDEGGGRDDLLPAEVQRLAPNRSRLAGGRERRWSAAERDADGGAGRHSRPRRGILGGHRVERDGVRVDRLILHQAQIEREEGPHRTADGQALEIGHDDHRFGDRGNRRHGFSGVGRGRRVGKRLVRGHDLRCGPIAVRRVFRCRR